MRGSRRTGIETVAKNNGEGIIKKLWYTGRGIEVWRIGLSEHTKVVVTANELAEGASGYRRSEIGEGFCTYLYLCK